ncbi:hypothetical protein GGR58DRAFT_517952 [Xylaria digitata]|nr:hypothetical protein GGR58DRAFT_517952 [Xylaria digitata]
MRYVLPIFAASAVDAIHSVSVVSSNAYTCNAVSGVDIAFASDEKSITTSFPPIALTVEAPAHGYLGGNSSIGCGATVEFEDWPSGVRFAILGVAWHTGKLNLTKNNLLHSLRAKVDLLDVDVDPALSDFQGKYEFSTKNPRPYWSTCFNGYLANTTKISFQLGGSSSGGGTSQPGWSMDLGLIWESCYAPNETTWGQKANSTVKRSKALYPML